MDGEAPAGHYGTHLLDVRGGPHGSHAAHAGEPLRLPHLSCVLGGRGVGGWLGGQNGLFGTFPHRADIAFTSS
ncbi:MAG: hypothetical protein U1U88_001087 [Lawsonella clevelandensis]